MIALIVGNLLNKLDQGQQQLQANQNGLAGLSANNKLLQSEPGAKNFKQEMALLQEQAGNERGGFNPTKDLPAATNESKTSTQVAGETLVAANPEALTEAEITKLKDLQEKAIQKENQQIAQQESAIQDSVEAKEKYTSSEQQMAAAAQANQEEVTEAAQQGNVAQQEQQNTDNANDRKQQLANWDDLAPRIVEDTKNMAVRIDIPGLNDIETLIVRMNNGKVKIQAVGSKATSEMIRNREAELKGILGQKNVAVDTIQAFDSATLKQGKA